MKEKKKKFIVGTKYDNGKPRWDLISLDEIEDVVRVLNFGALRYDDHNWKQVVGAKRRYFSAAMRHVTDWQRGKMFDTGEGGSGLPVLAHAVCDLLFLMWFDRHGYPKEKENK